MDVSEVVSLTVPAHARCAWRRIAFDRVGHP
jgi:hypothetical protein